ncbi:MAG: RagB/SusD family nutrient uptake outer membrane protein [Pedobacter sp.]|nr:MAG: RagB/SusD family nutrient uptake outer membrane protein [Pedobacter sp.]
MKKIFSISAMCVILTLASCNKMIDEQPISEGTLNNFLRTSLEADAAVAGMYGEFQQTMMGNGQYQNRMLWWGESRSDNWERRDAYTVNATDEIQFNGLTELNNWADWSWLYSTISRANLLIKKLPEVKNYSPVGTIGSLTPAREASLMAQSYAMRALCYFWIVRVWGDAPLRITPYENLGDVAEQARDPQEKILDQCIADLTQAYSLTTKAQTPNVFYIGEGAICAMMADIYMWRKDYPNAAIWFQRLFASRAPTGKVFNASGVATRGTGGSIADLQPGVTWNAQFVTPAASVESIFYIHWDFLANGCACMAGTSRTDNEPYIRMATQLWTEWPTKSTQLYGTTTATTDLRVKQTYNITSATNQPIRDRSVWKLYAGAYVAPTATAGYNFTPTIYTGNLPGTRETNVYLPVYRLSGMYLMYAEALNKLGDMANSVRYLNLIKTRAGVPTVDVASFTQNTLEAEILQERQYELFGEGVRWFDLVRTDRVQEIMDPILNARQIATGIPGTGWGTDKRRYLWPLHNRVLYSNSLLVQNQPY